MSKSKLAKLSLVAVSSIFGLLIGEVGMRAYGYVKDIDFRLYNREFHNSDRLPKEIFLRGGLRPSTQALALTSDFRVHYKINKFGMRDKEYSLEKPRDKTRIVAMGDSFTFGEGVPYGRRFSDILEAEGSDTEVLNLGVPGYGLDQTLQMFHFHGRHFEPDAVLIFMHKPLFQRKHVPKFIQDGEVVFQGSWLVVDRNQDSAETYIAEESKFWKQSENLFTRHSYLISYLSYHYQIRQLQPTLETDDKKRVGERIKQKYGPNEVREANWNSVNGKRTLLIMEKFADVCREAGVRLIVVNIDAKFTFHKFREIIGGENYLDLAKLLSELGSRKNLRFKYNRHFNAETNKFIGEQLIRSKIIGSRKRGSHQQSEEKANKEVI